MDHVLILRDRNFLVRQIPDSISIDGIIRMPARAYNGNTSNDALSRGLIVFTTGRRCLLLTIRQKIRRRLRLPIYTYSASAISRIGRDLEVLCGEDLNMCRNSYLILIVCRGAPDVTYGINDYGRITIGN